MGSIWNIKLGSNLNCDEVEKIIKETNEKEVYKGYAFIAVKILIGFSILGGTITGSVFLGRVSPLGAAALAGGVSFTVASLKIITYALKIPPFNKLVVNSNTNNNSEINIERQGYIKFLRSATKKMNIQEIYKFSKNHRSELNANEYFKVFVKVLLKTNYFTNEENLIKNKLIHAFIEKTAITEKTTRTNTFIEIIQRYNRNIQIELISQLKKPISEEFAS